MALDQQSNWNIQMAQPLKAPLRSKDLQSSAPVPVVLPPTSPNPRSIPLPLEIISHILSFIPHRRSTQQTFYSLALISRTWYSGSIAHLYKRPYLTPSNFTQFIYTVCPSKNAHIRLSSLALLVRSLDMSELVHNSSRSLTARLLGRLKHHVEEFVAPQASFSINSLAALSKCIHLQHLDLSLISASLSTSQLFKTLSSLPALETLYFPRSSSSSNAIKPGKGTEIYSWPKKLDALHLAGGIDDSFFLTHLHNVPPTLKRLSIQHCPSLYADALLSTLSTLGPQLKHLTIRHPMPRLYASSLNTILALLPCLIVLRVSADYITSEFFKSIPNSHTLQILDLECSPQAGAEVDIPPSAVYDAVETGYLSNLRIVRVSARLSWLATERRRRDVQDLCEAMEDNEMERPFGVEVGVWGSMPN